MITIEEVRASVAEPCPKCGREPDNCAIRMTRELLQGFDLKSELASDLYYPEFYNRFRREIAHAYEIHLDRRAGDRNENTRCLDAALFGSGSQRSEALGAQWLKEYPIEPINDFIDFPKKQIDYKTKGLSRETYIELKGNFSFNDLGAAFLEAVLLTRSSERFEGTPVFYLMTLHSGYRQTQYDRAVRQMNALGKIVADNFGVDLRYVNLLPFYDNGEEILQFLDTIRG